MKSDSRHRLSEQRFKAAVEVIDGVLWTNNAAGEMVGVQEAWGALTGQSFEEYNGYGWAKAVHEEDAQPTIDAWQKAVDEKRPFVFEHRLRVYDGTLRLFSVRAVPMFDADGKILEWVGVHLDITDERALQQKLARIAQQLSLSLDAGQTGTWEADLVTGKYLWDERMFGLWGIAGPDAPSLEETYAYIHPSDRDHVARERQKLRDPDGPGVLDVEFRLTRASDGDVRWLTVRGQAQETTVAARTVVGIARDITDRKRREQQIQFLMGELNHRTKNILAVVQAIARQTARNAPSLDRFSEDFDQRIAAMAGSLDLLIKENWSSASMLDLVRLQTSPVMGEDGDRIKLTGDDIALLPEAAQNLGLALHELSTNAAKYGALSVPGGHIALGWWISEGVGANKTFSLVWKEHGGPLVTKPIRKGFGDTVMNRLVKASLSGDALLEFEPDGVKWSVNIPVSQILHGNHLSV